MNKYMKFNPIFWFYVVVEWFFNKLLIPVIEAVDEFYKAREKD